MIEILLNFFTKSKEQTKTNTPEGYCPNCWGNQEYDNAAALAMTGALNVFDDAENLRLNQRISDIRNSRKAELSSQQDNGESSNSTSNWWPW